MGIKVLHIPPYFEAARNFDKIVMKILGFYVGMDWVLSNAEKEVFFLLSLGHFLVKVDNEIELFLLSLLKIFFKNLENKFI